MMRRRSYGRLLMLSLLVVALGVVTSSPAFADIIYTVSRDHDADWHFESGFGCPSVQTADISGQHAFQAGPVGAPGDSPAGTPPENTGSLRLNLGADGDNAQFFRNTRYGGKRLSQLESLVYWTYTPTVAIPPKDFNPAILIRLEIDKNNDGARDDALIFEPSYQDTENADGQHAVMAGRWQQWIAQDANAIKPEGNWYLESLGTGATNFHTLSEWVVAIGDAAIVNPAGRGGVVLGTGCGSPTWDNFSGNTDEFRIKFTGDVTETVFDMEPDVPGSATRLDCDPEADSNRTGESHTITCTARNDSDAIVNGADIDVEATGANDPDGTDSPDSPDFHCTTDADGNCPIRHGPGGTGQTPAAGTTSYRAWIDEDGLNPTTEADRQETRSEGDNAGSRPEPDDTDVIEKTWTPSRLNCEPETAAPPVGGSHTITCTVTDVNGTLVPGTKIDMEATGVNDPDGSNSNSLFSPDFQCTTGTNGSCSIVHGPLGKGQTSSAGKTTYRGWIDVGSGAEADATEGQNEATSAGGRSEIDDTDVVDANWGGVTGTPSPTPTSTRTPTPTPTSTRTPTPTPTPTGTPTPTPSPTPSPRRCGGPGDNGIPGTPGDDVIIGSPGADVICGFGGDDVIRGGLGDDELRGGSGDDKLYGGRGADKLLGGGGKDALHGGKGKDRLNGGTGKDSCLGGPGTDRLSRCE